MSLSEKAAKLAVGRTSAIEGQLGVSFVVSTFFVCLSGSAELSIHFVRLMSFKFAVYCLFAISGIANFDFIIIDFAADLSVFAVHYC